MSGRDRRDLDRRGPDRDDYSRKHPSSSARPQLNEYWIAGEGINRQVLQAEICKYLGSEATCRPGEYQGVPGFKIKALRPFTPDMLDDLRTASKAFTNENRAYVKRHDRELAYSDSQTYEQTNPQGDYDRSYVGRDSPAYPPNPAGGYPVSTGPGYPASSVGFSSAPSSAFAPHSSSHPGLSLNSSAAPMGYSQQDHYGHARRDGYDTRGDAMMRDAPPSGYASQNHPPFGHASNAPYDSYAAQRGGDSRGDARMGGYDGGYGGGNYNNGPSRRQEPPYHDNMQGIVGGGPGYGSGVPSRNGLAYDQGYDGYSRGAPPIDRGYGARR